MASSFEKSVKGATKIKLAAPKSKYVEHILIATHAGEAGVAEIFRALQNRLRDSTWTIVFKSLIIVHLMIREGEPDVTLKFIASNPRKLATSTFSDVQLQGRNIRHYADYLLERARTFKETKVDFVRGGEGRLKRLSVEKGLLRETEAVQHQITALLKCDILSSEPENEITLTAFRLLVTDLLALFHVMNEGVINLLEHFFEMSKYDAERALAIYKMFATQTNMVVEFLAVARSFQHATRLEVPRLKHAPTSLTGSLEDYTNDPDFEINRRQYLAQQEAKKGRGNVNGSSKPFPTDGSKATSSRAAAGKAFPSPKGTAATPVKQEAKGPAPDLIDFFESIEQNQQPMAQTLPGQSQQYNRFQPQAAFQQPAQFQQPPLQQQQPQQFQQTDQFSQMTGSIPQQSALSNQQFSTPFGQQNNTPLSQGQQQPSIQSNFTGAGFGGFTPQPQTGFNLQQSSLSSIPQNGIATFDSAGFQQQSTQQATGQVNASAGATNPFRQSMMMPNSTGAPSAFGGSPSASPIGRQNTNPFARNLAQPGGPNQGNMFNPTNSTPSPTPFGSLGQPEPKAIMPLSSTPTGTNPFARNTASQPQQQPATSQPQAALMPNPTGSTNPFRQSVFQNQQIGAGWQQGQGTIGGLEQLPTVPIFPRPGEQQTGQGQFGWS